MAWLGAMQNSMCLHVPEGWAWVRGWRRKFGLWAPMERIPQECMFCPQKKADGNPPDTQHWASQTRRRHLDAREEAEVHPPCSSW